MFALVEARRAASTLAGRAPLMRVSGCCVGGGAATRSGPRAHSARSRGARPRGRRRRRQGRISAPLRAHLTRCVLRRRLHARRGPAQARSCGDAQTQRLPLWPGPLPLAPCRQPATPWVRTPALNALPRRVCGCAPTARSTGRRASDASFLHARRCLRFSACAPTPCSAAGLVPPRTRVGPPHASITLPRATATQARRQPRGAVDGAPTRSESGARPQHGSASAQPQRAELHEPCDRGTSWVCPSMCSHCSQARVRAARRRRLAAGPCCCCDSPVARERTRHTLTLQHPAQAPRQAKSGRSTG
jgi:hypothetical protein